VDALRGTLIGSMHFDFALDYGVLGGITVLSMIVGSYLFSRIQV
jgi:hypothetical protein